MDVWSRGRSPSLSSCTRKAGFLAAEEEEEDDDVEELAAVPEETPTALEEEVDAIEYEESLLLLP